jgi:Fic family protein
VPPPPARIKALLADLCRAINRDHLPPIAQAALVHAQFETIHPFDDGNGRTGRALIHVVLRRRGVARAYVPPISVVLAAARKRYINGLIEFRSDRVSEWVGQFAESASRSAHLARAYLGAVQKLDLRWRKQLTKGAAPRADAAAWAIMDVLPAHPMISAPVAAAATGRAKAAIYQAISQLEDAGVLLPVSRSLRNQIWEVAGLLDLLADFESGRLPIAAAE